KQNYSAIVRKSKSPETLHIQQTNSKEKYLNGVYDLEILSLPRLEIKNIEIMQSHTTTVEVPSPGILTILRSTSGRTDIFKVNNNTLTWVYQLAESSKSENLYLLPGVYRVIHKPKNAIGSAFTVEQQIVVKSGTSSNVKF